MSSVMKKDGDKVTLSGWVNPYYIGNEVSLGIVWETKEDAMLVFKEMGEDVLTGRRMFSEPSYISIDVVVRAKEWNDDKN